MSSLNEEAVHMSEEVITKNWYESTPEAEDLELPQCNEAILPSRRVISVTTLSKIHREKLILAGIENTHQLAQFGQGVIEKILGISPQDTAALRSKVKCIEAPIAPITGLEALKATKTISSGCLAIDHLFSFTPLGTRGTKRAYFSEGEHDLIKDAGSNSQPSFITTEKAGIPLGSITEISGASGSGKSTFCLQLAIMSQSSDVPEEHYNTIYIDTDGSLPCLIPRIQSICNAKGINSEKVLNQIQTFRIFFLDELISLLEKLKNSWMDTHADVKLLIIDSIARPFMNLLNQPEAVPSKQYSIYQLNLLLQAFSSFGVAVINVNHLDLVPGQRPQTSYSAPLQVELGDTWSHFANHHLMLLFGRQKKRYALLTKSSQWPTNFAAFEIQEAGLSHESNVGTKYPDFEEETPSTSRQASDLKDLVSSLAFDQEQKKRFFSSFHKLRSQAELLGGLSQSQDTSEPQYHPSLTQASQSGFPDNFHPPLSFESTLTTQGELGPHVYKEGEQSQSQRK